MLHVHSSAKLASRPTENESMIQWRPSRGMVERAQTGKSRLSEVKTWINVTQRRETEGRSLTFLSSLSLSDSARSRLFLSSTWR